MSSNLAKKLDDCVIWYGSSGFVKNGKEQELKDLLQTLNVENGQLLQIAHEMAQKLKDSDYYSTNDFGLIPLGATIQVDFLQFIGWVAVLKRMVTKEV